MKEAKNKREINDMLDLAKPKYNGKKLHEVLELNLCNAINDHNFYVDRCNAIDEAIIKNVLKKHKIEIIKREDHNVPISVEDLFIDGKLILTIDSIKKTIVHV